jgi:hypothetical protein
VRSALVETPSGPLMESLDLFVRRYPSQRYNLPPNLHLLLLRIHHAIWSPLSRSFDQSPDHSPPSSPRVPHLHLHALATHASLTRLEATDSPGVRYALCAIASELCKGDAGLARLRDINFAQALERLRAKKSLPKDAALEIIIDHLVQELRPKIA